MPAQACEVSSVFADGSTEHARYDGDGHLLELSHSATGAARSWKEVHVWREGLEGLRRVDYSDGLFSQSEWTYDARRRVSSRVDTGATQGYGTQVDFTYDAQDRISQVFSQFRNPFYVRPLTSTYVYDAEGRLSAITGDDTCGQKESRCATLSYWPNGRLKRHAWDEYLYETFTEEYDELGQSIRSVSMHSDSSHVSLRAYDASGRLVRLRQHSNSSSSGREALTTTVHDPAGRRERLADDSVNHFTCERNPCPVFSQRITRRTTFLCDTDLVALDEWDSDEDGAVDAWRTHERDATGRLVREAYSGTPGMDREPVRRDFRYECP